MIDLTAIHTTWSYNKTLYLKEHKHLPSFLLWEQALRHNANRTTRKYTHVSQRILEQIESSILRIF